MAEDTRATILYMVYCLYLLQKDKPFCYNMWCTSFSFLALCLLPSSSHEVQMYMKLSMPEQRSAKTEQPSSARFSKSTQLCKRERHSISKIESKEKKGRFLKRRQHGFCFCTTCYRLCCTCIYKQ